MLRRWGFAVVVAVVEHTMEPAAEAIEHKMATAAVVAHREVFAVDTGSFGMEVALHTGLVVVTVLPALLHSWCKIVDRL